MEQTLIPGDAGGAMAPPYFGRSVNHISTEGGRLCPTNNTGTPGFLDLPTALTHWWSFEKIFTWKLVIKFLFYLIFRPLMRLLLSWTPLTRIATRTRRWSCNFCVTIWLFGHLMLQPTTQTLEMPLQLLSKKNNKKKKLVKSRQASAIGLAFPCSILQFFLLLQNLKSWTTLSTPLLVHSFLSTHQKHHHMYSLKKTQPTNPWQNTHPERSSFY